MKVTILALFGCVLLQPLACTHEGQPPAYGSDINDSSNSAEGQPGAAPDATGGNTSTKEGPDVGGTNTTGGTGATGGSTSTGGTTSAAGATTGGTGAYNGGTGP